MSAGNGERRPQDKGGAPGDQASSTIGSSVATPSPLVNVDPDGGAQLVVSLIVKLAATALELGTDPVEALQDVLHMGRMLDTIWLEEQFAEVHR